jgi:ribonuclease G
VDYEKPLELIDPISPRTRFRLVLYDESEPIFWRFAVEAEIENLLRRKVWLKSGGHLTIDSTETAVFAARGPDRRVLLVPWQPIHENARK